MWNTLTAPDHNRTVTLAAEVQRQRIGSARAAALTHLISRLSSLRGQMWCPLLPPIKKINNIGNGLHRVQTQAWFIWKLVVSLPARFWGNPLFLFYYSLHPAPLQRSSPTPPALSLASSTSSSLRLILHSTTSLTFFPGSLLPFHRLSGCIYILPTITYSSHFVSCSNLPSAVALYSRRTGPMDSRVRSVWKYLCERLRVEGRKKK